VKECVRQMMRKVASAALLSKYSYKGMRQKRSFSGLTLSKVLVGKFLKHNDFVFILQLFCFAFAIYILTILQYHTLCFC